MVIKNRGFTLIEILVVIGITITLMLVVGGVMTTSFKAKNDTDSLVIITTESQVVISKLKQNIFDAEINTITCPVGVGDSISFTTKNGGMTSLLCDSSDINDLKIASKSAQNGEFKLNSDKVKITNCENFVSCTMDGQLVTSVDFKLTIGNTEFVTGIVPR
jgi:prepilin-type N-terminal cleavage/methylation domain-containing protein